MLALAALALAPLAAAYAWNVQRNVEARERARAACARLDAAADAQWERLAPLVAPLFEDEAPAVERIFRGVGAEVCPGLDAELADPWRWSWGRTYRPHGLTDEERAHVDAALARARANCPRVLAEALAPLARSPEEARSLAASGCADVFADLEQAARAAGAEDGDALAIEVWDWPAELEGLASAIEQMGGAPSGGVGAETGGTDDIR